MNQIITRKKPQAIIEVKKDFPDRISFWLEAYFRFEVNTSQASQKIQKRDLGLFLSFMLETEGRDERCFWTPRLSRAFKDYLRSTLTRNDRRRWGDRTINRILAHLKTFSKWVHKLRPFPLGDPTAKLKLIPEGSSLEIERAITKGERRRILDAPPTRSWSSAAAPVIAAATARAGERPISAPATKAIALTVTAPWSTPSLKLVCDARR